MAKKEKDLLNGFEFKKFNELNNGIEIPISNSLKDPKTKKDSEPISQMSNHSQDKANNKPIKAEKEPKATNVIIPRNFDFVGKGIEPMVNVVPVSKKVVPTKPKVVPTNEIENKVISKKHRIEGFFDEVEYGALMTKQEQILYLVNRGWALRVETRRNTLYHYAIRYINRKKERIYLGSINNT